MGGVTGIGIHDRVSLGKSLIGAADHDGQHTIFRTRLTAGNRRIHKGAALLFRGVIKFTGQTGRGRGVIDKDRTGFQPGQNAVIAIDDRAHIIIITDTGKGNVGALGGLAGRINCRAAILAGPFLGLRFGAVIDLHLMTGFDQIPRHGIAHDTETDKSHLQS